MKTTRLKTHVYRIQDGWLVQLCLMAVLLLFGASLDVSADNDRDIITFTGGHTDPKYPGVYFADADSVTISRPLGATASREASITIAFLGRGDEFGQTITFLPGETTKTFKGFEAMTVLRTNHADAEYQTLVFSNITHVDEEPDSCTYTSQLELLQEAINANPYDFNRIFCFRWGENVIFRLGLNTPIRVTADSRMVIQTRYTDHTGLANNADDYAMSRTREVVLTPINVGAVGREVLYLYHPQDDEYLYSYQYKGEYSEYDNTQIGSQMTKIVAYKVCEVGPFEVANPAEGAINRIFFSREDMGNLLTYALEMYPGDFYPTFSNISINKTSFKSGETMIITAKMDNWRVIKRARLSEFATAFGVTLDDSQTIEPYRFTLDETTGTVTYYVTAPTVTENTHYNLDFGPIWKEQVYDENIMDLTEVRHLFTSSEGMFAVTVTSEAATPVPATAIDFVDLPADGSNIRLQDDGYNNIMATTYPLAITSTPVAATDAGTVTYSVTNADGAGATIDDNNGAPLFNTGTYTGTVTLTATLASDVSTQRTYHLTTSPSRPVHYANTYLAGTNQPKFQFKMDCFAQLDNTWDWTAVDDSITVVYTHANGTTWTERYKFSKLTYYSGEYVKDWGSFYGHYDESHIWRLYDLPFVFTTEHPDATIDQIGSPVVTAEVLLDMQNANGNIIHARSTATLEARLKDISFGGYYSSNEHYHYSKQPTLTADVSYLTAQGFIVGYEIPELGISETYDSRSGDPVPDWLDLHEDLPYVTATIMATPDLDKTQSYKLSLYTLAQCTTNPDAVLERFHSCDVTFSPISPEGHVVYRVNGKDVNSNLTFDNIEYFNTLNTQLKEDGTEIFLNPEKELDELYQGCQAFFNIYDDAFDGADVTLTCEQDTIQTMKHYKGCFTFMPPSDGRTYHVEVFYPGYNLRYDNTFVNRKFTNVYTFLFHFHGTPSHLVYYHFTSGGKDFSMHYSNIKGLLYTDNPVEFFADDGESRMRIPFPFDKFKPLRYDIKPELKIVGSSYSYEDALKYSENSYQEKLKRNYAAKKFIQFIPLEVNWDDVMAGTTLITVVDGQGQPVNDATLNFACVDQDLANPVGAGTAAYDEALGGYMINTDSQQYAELIEVVTSDNQQQLHTMYLWNYDYSSPQNTGKRRRHTIVLDDSHSTVNASFETLQREGNFDPEGKDMTASIYTTDLKAISTNDIVNYSETVDYEHITKHVKDERLGPDGWEGTHFARLNFTVPYVSGLDVNQFRLEGNQFPALAPAHVKNLSTAEFTTFSKNYCLVDFDIVGKIEPESTVSPALLNGTQTILQLPNLHNQTVDMAALTAASDVQIEGNSIQLNKVDDQGRQNGIDMKDMNKAFDKFNIQLPDVFPFTVNIEREGDYFIVRGVYEHNFLPGGKLMDALDDLGDKAYFDEQFQACMDAVNSAEPIDDDFFEDIPRVPSASAFVGIKGFISGIGHINRETGKFEINFLDGGITFEASASARGTVSFGIGGFGMSVDAKLAMTMEIINANAMEGNVGALPKIDFMLDQQCRLKVCAWAYAGIDIWIAKATVGVRGGACIDLQNRAVFHFYDGTHHAGARASFQAAMEAYAEVRVLWWKKKKSWKIFNVKKVFYAPNNGSNPLHPDYERGYLFETTSRNVALGYKKLKRRVIADLGTPIISNISGMARPTYLLGGESLLFNNLKTPSNYNDDCLQLYNDGSKTDFVNTGVEAPMYDFASDYSEKAEVVAFEQLSTAVNSEALLRADTLSQQKSVSEMSEIHVAWRQKGGSWQNQKIGSLEGSACVTPAVAVTKEQFQTTHAAVIWQQGKAMYSDAGDRYIDGSLMLSRYNGTEWSEPMEIMRLNRRNVPIDYQMTIKNNGGGGVEPDSILVVMTLKQDINNDSTPARLAFVSVTYDYEQYKYKTHTRYTRIAANKPQLVRVLDPKSFYHFDGEDPIIYDGTNLLAYLVQRDDGDGELSSRDLVLTSLYMNGEPTGKINGLLGMDNRTVNDYRLVADVNARSIADVGLVWSQSDQELISNSDGTQTANIKNRLYTSKMCSHEKHLYFSTPVEVATMPDDVSLASMDGYLDGLNMRVAYCVTNDEDGGAVLESDVPFDNAIDHKISYNPYNVSSSQLIPVTVTVVNNGFEPIKDIELTLGDEVTNHDILLMPQESIDLSADYTVTDDFNGTINYDVQASFIAGNSNALRVPGKGRRGAKMVAPRRTISQEGTQQNVRQVDIALKMLSKKTDANGVTTIMAEVNNASLLPLASDMKVKVGLYNSPVVYANTAAFAEQTLNAAALYDATEKQNKVQIVTLTVDQPDFDQMLYLCTVPMAGTEEVKDVKPTNNVLPVNLVGKYILGDANNDGKVSVADVTAVINRINGSTSGTFIEKAANVNKDEKISIADVTGIINIINK